MLNQRFLQRTSLWLLLLCSLIFISGSQGVTVITTCIGLQAMSSNLTGSYQLGNDINCSATASWNSGAGFVPIGKGSSSITTSFTGTFDGQGFKIFGLVVNLPSTGGGLFGSTGSSALIQSVGLIGGSIVGSGGVLVASNQGTVSNCYSTGSSVVSGNSGVGGLIGYNSGVVMNSYATSSASGLGAIGGLVGGNQGTVSNCYSTGAVSASPSGYVGGLVGQNNIGGIVISAYWNIQTSLQTSSAGGIGLSTQYMQQASSFSSWDFSSTWAINPGKTYPLLQVFVTWPLLAIPLPNVTHFIGNPLSLSIPANSFTDSNGLQLSYSVLLANQQPLPAWLLFQASTQTFVGTPLSGAQGVLNIVIIVCNVPSKCVQDVFSITIPDRAPVVQTTIPPQQAVNGQFFEFILPTGVFFDVDSDHLLLTATTMGNQPLPAWLSFNAPFGIFSGTSMLRGTYMINLTANDNYGGQVSIQFNIVTPNTAPKDVVSFPNQVLIVGVSFSFALPPGSFVDIDNDPMTYSAALFGGAALLPWLSFDSSSLSFTGTPNAEGFLMVGVTATDTYNASVSLYFGVTVLAATGNAPPVLVIRMQDQTVIVGKNIQLFLPTGMFVDPNGYALNYSATLSDGSALPSWLTFNTTELVFTGVPTTVTTIKINVAVTNGHGGSAQNAFNLMTQASQPPVLINQLPNQQVAVGTDFSYTVPDNTFYDASGAHLIYTATRLGGGSLPGWLKFDASTRVFSGNPKPTDTNTYAARTSNIQVCASDGQEKSCTNFDLSVTGQSPLAEAITVILSIASALSTLYGIYRNQAWIWNTFATRKYKKPSQRVNLGDSFTHQFSVLSKSVKHVRIFDEDKNPLQDNLQLIAGIKFERSTMTLSGTPSDAESFWICAQGNPGYWWCDKSNHGFNLEAFMLHVVDPNGTTSMTPLKEMTDV